MKHSPTYRRCIVKKHPLYRRWVDLKQITTNPNDKSYPTHGGKGM